MNEETKKLTIIQVPLRTLPVPSPRQGMEMRQRDVTYLHENM